MTVTSPSVIKLEVAKRTSRYIGIEAFGPSGFFLQVGKGTLGMTPVQLKKVTPSYLMQGQQLQLSLWGHL